MRYGKQLPGDLLSINQVMDVFRQLQELHGLGLVHRDIRAPNVLLFNGTTQLIDYGFSAEEEEAFKGRVPSTISDIMGFGAKNPPWTRSMDIEMLFRLVDKNAEMRLHQPTANTSSILQVGGSSTFGKVDDSLKSKAKAKGAAAKKAKADMDDSEDIKLPKKAPIKRAPAKKLAPKKKEMSDSEDEGDFLESDDEDTKPVKKAPVKKAPEKKAPVKKTPANKAPVKKAPVKKAPVKKTPAKKAPVKKAPEKKAPLKKTPAKKADMSDSEDEGDLHDEYTESVPSDDESDYEDVKPVKRAPVKRVAAKKVVEPDDEMISGDSKPVRKAPARAASKPTQKAAAAKASPKASPEVAAKASTKADSADISSFFGKKRGRGQDAKGAPPSKLVRHCPKRSHSHMYSS